MKFGQFAILQKKKFHQKILQKEREELLKWNKKHFSLFRKCSLLDIQNKLAKM